MRWPAPRRARTSRVALPQCAGRASHWRVMIGPGRALRRSGRGAPVRGERGPRRMDRETRVTARPGARAIPPEGRASRAPDAQTAAAYRRAAGQRCWACSAPDSEPVRLQRRAGERWVADATVQLCTACLAALHTPRLVRQLRLGRWTAAPAGPAAAESVGAGSAGTGADAPGETPPPLTLLKGA
jgi:hypothetical protein